MATGEGVGAETGAGEGPGWGVATGGVAPELGAAETLIANFWPNPQCLPKVQM